MNNNALHWVYGIHAVQSLLKTRPAEVEEIRITRGRDQRLAKIRQQAERLSIRCSFVEQKDLEALFADSEKQQARDGKLQGVAARCGSTEIFDETFLQKLIENKQQPLLLILDGVTDPHNLGACLRSADAAGADAVIAPKDRSVGITPVVSKVACGAAETMPFVVVTNLARTMKWLQQQGVWIIGTAGEADQSLFEASLDGSLALVMGAEQKGMRRLVREHCDHLVKLPMAGSVSSLNVSVATGICLFEAVRQRAVKRNQ